MTNQTPADIIAGLDRAADRALAPLASAAMTTDAPSGARAAHGGFVGALNEIRATAANGSASIAALHEEATDHYNNGLPEASRAATQRADAAKAALSTTLENVVGKAQLTLSVVEAEARMALVPPVSTDAGARSLARQEIESAVAGHTGAGLVSELGKLVGQSEQLDSEILSDWGSRLILRNAAGTREGEELTRLFTGIAIARLAAVSPPRSAMTAAAVKVCQAIPKARGALAAVASSSAIAAGLR